MKGITRRAALAAAGMTFAAPALAQGWAPDRPIRWLVGYPPGGGTDVLARLIAAGMSARLGVPIVVENRPGAATNLAAEAAASAAPDGTTVFTAGNETTVFNPALYRRLPFDADTGLRPLGLMARFHLVLCTRPGGPATPAAFAEAARARAGRMDYGSPGIGSPHHLATERLARELGVTLNHVPYRGMAPVMTDLLNGTVEAAVLDMAAGAEMIRSRRVQPLVLLSAERLPGLDLPTVGEAYGLRGFAAHAWQGLTAPGRTPDDIARRLSAELAATVAEPAVQGRMREIGLDPLTGGAEEHRALIASERAIYWPLIRGLNLSLD
jgi:tripartite-type tricarboxylate transporter receptor subunit TctC